MKNLFLLIIITAFLPFSILLGISIGPVFIGPAEILRIIFAPDVSEAGPAGVIIRELRLPRLLTAAAAGWALGAAGTAFQGIFRNPLADPYVIGASSGASFGAAIALSVHIPLLLTVSDIVFAFAGSIATVGIVFIIAGTGQKSPPMISILLAGTAVSSLLSAAVTLLMVLQSRDVLKIFYWLLGSFNNSSYRDVILLAAFLLPGILILQLFSGNLDIMSFGDEHARSAGVPVETTRYAVLVSATLITAASVSVAGIIGFAGLISPHICRLIFGPVHRRLYYASGVTGSILLVTADIASRTLLYPVELPVGVITSLLGAPFFLYLLYRREKFV